MNNQTKNDDDSLQGDGGLKTDPGREANVGPKRGKRSKQGNRPKAAAKSKSVSGLNADTGCTVDAKADAKANAETKARTKANSKAGTKAGTKAQADADAKADAEAQTDAKTQADAQANTKAQADAQADIQADADAKTDAQTQTDAKTQADAQANTNTHADAQADVDPQSGARPQPHSPSQGNAVAPPLRMTDLSRSERPREKMMRLGARAMSDAELLALLIGSGSAGENVLTLTQRMLADCGGDLARLSRWDLSDLARYKGMGPAKSLTVMAALELGNRRALQEHHPQDPITTARDVYDLCLPLMRDLPTEEVWVLLLGASGRLIRRTRISQGGIDQAICDVRTILREALVNYATQIVLVHNHPSGACRPSEADRRLTTHVQKAAATMNIRLLDHVVISDGAYYSFCEEGEL